MEGLLTKDKTTGHNFGLLPAAVWWLTETSVILGNIYAGDTKALLKRRR